MRGRSDLRRRFIMVAILGACPVGLGAVEPPATGNPLQLLPDHATASVENLEAETAWYERVLGFREVGRNGGADFQVVHLLLGDYRIDLAWQKGSTRPRLPGYLSQGWMHVVFRSPMVDSVYQRLQERGTDARADRNDKGELLRVVLHDPEGNEIEVVSSQRAALMNGHP